MYLAPSPQLSVARVPIADGTAGIFQTVRVMRSMVEAAKSDPAIMQAATNVVFLAPELDQFSEAEALFLYVRDYVRYMRDPVGLESVAYPATTLQRMVGDCDDQSTLLAALFEAVGYPTRFVIAGYQRREYEHVFVEVFVNGQWFTCDPTEKHGFGWAPPSPLIEWKERV